MYFANFPKIVYDFDLSSGVDYRIITDITRNVRLRKQILENISVYDYYDIAEGETPEIISEKIYGTPYYHWVIMLANQRYDYVNDFPLTQLELDTHIDKKYGDKKHHTRDYKVDGFIKEGVNIVRIAGMGVSPAVGKVLINTTYGYKGRIDNVISYDGNSSVLCEVSLRTGQFGKDDIVQLYEETSYGYIMSSTIPGEYTTTSNYDYEFALNESKRRIKIVDPKLVEQIVKEFKDIL